MTYGQIMLKDHSLIMSNSYDFISFQYPRNNSYKKKIDEILKPVIDNSTKVLLRVN